MKEDAVGRGDELEAAWRDVVARLDLDPDDEHVVWSLGYNGPDDEWLWTAILNAAAPTRPFAPVGWGETPAGALRALVKAVDHNVGYWPITRPWDEKSREWAEEEGFG